MRSRPRKNRRRTGWWIALAVLVVLFLLVLVSRQGIGRYVINRALERVGSSMNVRISYAKLTGDIYSRPTFEGLAVAMNGDSLSVAELTFGYDLFGMVRGRFAFSQVSIEEPRLFLVSKERREEPDTARRVPKFPRATVKRLLLRGGQVWLDNELRVDSLDVELALNSAPEVLRAMLYSAAGTAVREKLTLTGLTARCRVTGDSVVLDGLEAATRSSRLTGDVALTIDGKSISGELDDLRVELAEFTDQSGRIRVQGSAALEDGSRSADVDYAAEGLVLSGFELPRLVGSVDLEGSVAELEVYGRDPERGGFSFDGTVNTEDISFLGEMRLDSIALRLVDSSLPDLMLDAELVVGGRKTDSVGASVRARIRRGPDRKVAEDSVELVAQYRAGRIDVEKLEVRGDDGMVWADGWYKDGFLQADFVLDSFDLELAGLFAKAKLGGRATGMCRAKGDIDSVDVSGGFRVAGFMTNGFSIEDGLLELDLVVGQRLEGRLVAGGERVDLSGLEFDAAQFVMQDMEFDLRFDRPEDRLLASGTVELTRQGFDADVFGFQYATAAETLSIVQPFRVELEGDSLYVSGVRYELAGGWLELELRSGRRGNPWIQARSESLDLAGLRELLRIEDEMSGVIGFEVTGTDTYHVSITGRDISVPAYDNLSMKSMGATLDVTMNRAEVERFWFVHRKDTSVIAGQLDYEIDRTLEPGEMDFTVDGADPGPWVLFFLKDEVLHLEEGELYGRLAVTGTFQQPQIDGRIRVVHGQLHVPSVRTDVARVNGLLTATGKRLVLDKISGESSRGIVTGTGFLDFGPKFRVDTLAIRLRFDGVSMNPMPEVFALGGGDVTLLLGNGRGLTVMGSVDVDEALLTYDLGQRAGAAEESEYPLDLDLRIVADRGVWLRNRLVDIELSGDITLRMTPREQVLSGQLESRQGNVYYLDHTLRVTRGVISFPNINTINPELDIAAELPVRARLRSQGTAPDKVILSVKGTLEKPEFEFTSDPAGWDENDIITYLSLNVTADELSAMENREEIAKYVSQRLLSYFQTQATKQVRKYIGLDVVNVESEFAGGEANKVTVGKYVGRNFYVTYTQNFTGDLSPTFSVEYYLNRRNEIVGERSEDGRFSVRYQFKLRY
ncbi:MAG: translocation/assembly module TamB domain-containing protein [candidate division WOR-3 bacterium]|nr:MAG: translocation/assembly module TamB domain-containing protein [candidate division WOR-3 bacterium]